MIPIRKQIINNKQKRAVLVSCTLLAFMGFMVAMCFLWSFLSLICDMFATCLRQDKKVDNVVLLVC